MSQLERQDAAPAASRDVRAPRRPVLQALRDLKGRATLGDVVAATGLATDRAEASLRELLEERRGHLDVGADGTLVYSFDPKFVRRDAESAWTKLKRKAWSAFQTAFKVWIMLMLVVYALVFLALLVAAILKGDSDDIDLPGGGGGHRHGRGGHFPSFWFWYLVWSPNWGWGRPYYGRGWEKRQGKDTRVPFYRKVFAFVFGPDRPHPTRRQKDRSVLRLIRARQGVLTTTELVEHTGLPYHEADEEMARLMVTHGGDARVTSDGEVAYVFPELMVSAHGRVRERAPDPAWRRLETKLSLTGNSAGTNALIAGINGFNLIAAATAPLFIFPRLGFSGTAAWVGLVWVPVVFSTMFYGIPLARWWGVARQNVRRFGRNLRKVVLGHVFHETLVGARPIHPGEAVARVREALPKHRVDPEVVEEELVRLTAEFDAHVSATDDGGMAYDFPEIRRRYAAAEALRRELALEAREVGDIVYSSADDVQEQGRRDLETFDRDLAAGSPGGSEAADEDAGLDELAPGQGAARYLPPPDRVAYLEDFELVAFDEEMERRARVGARRA